MGPADRHRAGRDQCDPVHLPPLDRTGFPGSETGWLAVEVDASTGLWARGPASADPEPPLGPGLADYGGGSRPSWHPALPVVSRRLKLSPRSIIQIPRATRPRPNRLCPHGLGFLHLPPVLGPGRRSGPIPMPSPAPQTPPDRLVSTGPGHAVEHPGNTLKGPALSAQSCTKSS